MNSDTERDVWSEVRQWGNRARHTVNHLRRIDTRNLRMLPNAVSILAQPTLTDWYYLRHRLPRTLRQVARDFVLDMDSVENFQQHAAEAGYISTPDDGVLAGFSPDMRMSSLFAPHTGFTQQIPYFVNNNDDPLDGALEREGGFLGVTQEELTWLWEDEFNHDLQYRDGTGILDVTYQKDGMTVEESAYVLPGEEVVVRDFTIHNHADEPIDGLTYYLQANANNNRQYPFWASNRNRVTATDTITWTDLESDTVLTLATDAPVADSGTAETPLDQVFAAATSEAHGRYVAGYLDLDTQIPPNTSDTVSLFHAPATAIDPGIMNAPPDTRQQTTEQYWHDALEPVPDIPDRLTDQYQRSTVGLMKLYDPDSGSLSAAPHNQPAYYPSWIRDGAFNAVALSRAGQPEVAQDFLARFCSTVQEPDGSFKQCYDSRGDFAGIIEVENDQQPLYVWAVHEVYKETKDRDFLAAAWPTVKDALDYTMNAVVDNGLLAATPDFAEDPDDARQSLWTNTFAYRALHDGAAMAAALGQDGERYREAAQDIGDTVDDIFFPDDDTFYTHLTVSGPETDRNTIFSAAIYPTGWAADYGRTEQIITALDEFYDEAEEYWLPKEFLYAANLYRLGRDARADQVLDRMMQETTPAGTLAEQIDADGNQLFAALGWSNGKYQLAAHETTN